MSLSFVRETVGVGSVQNLQSDPLPFTPRNWYLLVLGWDLDRSGTRTLTRKTFHCKKTFQINSVMISWGSQKSTTFHNRVKNDMYCLQKRTEKFPLNLRSSIANKSCVWNFNTVFRILSLGNWHCGGSNLSDHNFLSAKETDDRE